MPPPGRLRDLLLHWRVQVNWRDDVLHDAQRYEQREAHRLPSRLAAREFLPPAGHRENGHVAELRKLRAHPMPVIGRDLADRILPLGLMMSRLCCSDMGLNYEHPLIAGATSADEV